MRVSITLAFSVTNNLLKSQILPGIEGQYMKELNTPAWNVPNYLPIKVALESTERQYMKESDTLAIIVTRIFLKKEVLPDIKGLCMKMSRNQLLK